MRKLLATLLIAAPAFLGFATGAAADQCVARPGNPAVLDCFNTDGDYLYSRDGYDFAAPPVYAYAPQPVYRPYYYRTYPRYYRSRVEDEPGCGRYQYWSESAGRCVSRYRDRDRDYSDRSRCGSYRYWSPAAGRCLSIARSRHSYRRDRDRDDDVPRCGRTRYWSESAGRCLPRARYGRARD